MNQDCEALCEMLRSQNIQDVELAVGIIRNLLVDQPGEEDVLTLRCIQEFLLGQINLGNDPWTFKQLELEIYERLN